MNCLFFVKNKSEKVSVLKKKFQWNIINNSEVKRKENGKFNFDTKEQMVWSGIE